MRYDNLVRADFLDRPNRFIAHVCLYGRTETVHVKNTGRCGELFLPGAEVYLTAPGTPGRKTAYDLVAVRKENGLVVNVDSQAPNLAAREWLDGQGYDEIRPEYRYGGSRIDFYMRRGSERFLLEVKGCTLEVNGTGYFPDAPTDRGVKHLRELTRAVSEGWRAMLAFVIQMEGVTRVEPNPDTHPAFGEALSRAQQAGVEVLFLPCRVKPDALEVLAALPAL